MKIVVTNDDGIDWNITGRHAEPVLKMVMAQELAWSHFWNINLPHPLDHRVLAYQFCGLDTNPHRYDFLTRGDDYIYQGSIHERRAGRGRMWWSASMKAK